MGFVMRSEFSGCPVVSYISCRKTRRSEDLSPLVLVLDEVRDLARGAYSGNGAVVEGRVGWYELGIGYADEVDAQVQVRMSLAKII